MTTQTSQPKRIISKSARKRMALAQKARWDRYRALKNHNTVIEKIKEIQNETPELSATDKINQEDVRVIYNLSNLIREHLQIVNGIAHARETCIILIDDITMVASRLMIRKDK